ncbi:MAG: hypothetical protein DME24_17545 [Verrucomicrobia bacterium]|nr:MAG: hypothetical protein DME24_17545 [Verrucomicrobiota bacterium]
MKPLHVVILTSLLAGCSSAHRDYEWHFIQGKIRIVPPVTRNLGPPAIGDGGTLQVHINDAVGKEFIIFIDHRIESPTPGAIYLNAYPGEGNSIRVLDERSFKQKVGDFDYHLSEPSAPLNRRPPSQSPASPEVRTPDSLRTPLSGGCG